jgi:DNA-binding CsgD family transcriptional regulator
MRFSNPSFIEVYAWNEKLNEDLLNICSPFMQQMNVNYICHAIHYNNGKQFNLMTNLPFMAFALEKEGFAAKSEAFCNRIAQLPLGETRIGIRNELPEDNIQSNFYSFDIWNGISFYKRLEDRIIVWAFSCSREKKDIISTYINSLPLFNQFILYLSYKIKMAYLKSPRHPLLLSGYNLPDYSPPTNNTPNNLMHNMQVPRYYYNDYEYLTEREYACISQLAEGKSTKGIAQYLKISPRTVETFIEKAKHKTNSYNKEHLINLYHDINKKNSYFP